MVEMFSRIRKGILLLGVFLFLFFVFVHPIPSLSTEAQNNIGLFFLTASLWTTNYLPLPVTGLLIFVLLPVLKILSPSDSFRLLGNRAVFFILGAFILSTGLLRTGLARRIALNFLKIFRDDFLKTLRGVFLIAFILSLFMPEHATAAILLPVVLEITHILSIKRGSREGKLLFLSLAWGAVIGGIGTMLGGARAPLAVGMLYETFGIKMSFIKWSLFALPVALAVGGIAILFQTIFVRKADEKITLNKLPEQKFPPLKREEKYVIIVYLITLFLWVFLNKYIPLSLSALIGAILLFATRTVKWKDAQDYVNWGVIIMYGGAIALGTSFVKSGAATWFASSIISFTGIPPFLILALLSLFSIFLTEFMSNTAAVALLLPIGFGISQSFSITPIAVTLAITIPGGLAFMLPVGTPPNAIAYSAGYYSIKDSVKYGVLLNISSWFILLLFIKFLWPLLGVKI